MGDFSKTNISNILKNYYRDKGVADACYHGRDQVFVSGMGAKKIEDVGGEKYFAPVKYGRSLGTGVTVSGAQTNASSALYEKWECDYKPRYHVVYVTTQAMRAAKAKGPGAYVDVLTEAIDDGRKAFAQEIELSLWKASTALRGTVSSVTATTLTLTNPEDVVNFEIGMTIGATGRTGTEPITAIDRSAGTLTAAAWTDISGIAEGDTLFRSGEPTYLPEGLESHFPTTRSGSSTLQGVTISTDWTRLAGVYVNASGATVSQAIMEAAARGSREGAEPQDWYLNPTDYWNLCVELQNAKIYDTNKDEVGFSGITIPTATGVGRVFSTKYCPVSKIYGLDKDTIEIVSQGKLIDFANDDDQILHMHATEDKYEIRLYTFSNMCVPDPGKNIVVTL
jgi:hypothetical protein